MFGNSVGQTLKTAEQLDDATVESFRVGDKLTFASWCNYICLIWSMKGIILCFYQRMVRFKFHNIYDKRFSYNY